MQPLVDGLEAGGKLKGTPTGELPGGEVPLTFSRRAQLLEALCERLRRTDRKEAAFQLATAHPELLSMVPTLAVILRRDAGPEQFPALAKLLEEAIRQAEIPVDLLRSQLAKICLRQAELAVDSSPSRRGEALNFLTQAYELEPGDFAVARSLAAAFRERHQDARAATVLKPFLQEDALPTERAAARHVLGLN